MKGDRIKEPKKGFVMSQYLMVLSLVGMTATTFMMVKGVFIPEISEHGFDLNNKDVRFVTFFFGGLYIFLLVTLCIPYEIFGYMKIQDDAIVFSHPFRGRRKLLFSEIKYIGIDFGVISGGVKQFWIYFSKVPIPPKYVHNMNRMALSKQTMRIQYRQEVFDALVYYLPKNLSKTLRANYSIIRLYKAEK